MRFPRERRLLKAIRNGAPENIVSSGTKQRDAKILPGFSICVTLRRFPFFFFFNLWVATDAFANLIEFSEFSRHFQIVESRNDSKLSKIKKELLRLGSKSQNIEMISIMQDSLFRPSSIHFRFRSCF